MYNDLNNECCVCIGKGRRRAPAAHARRRRVRRHACPHPAVPRWAVERELETVGGSMLVLRSVSVPGWASWGRVAKGEGRYQQASPAPPAVDAAPGLPNKLTEPLHRKAQQRQGSTEQARRPRQQQEQQASDDEKQRAQVRARLERRRRQAELQQLQQRADKVGLRRQGWGIRCGMPLLHAAWLGPGWQDGSLWYHKCAE